MVRYRPWHSIGPESSFSRLEGMMLNRVELVIIGVVLLLGVGIILYLLHSGA